MNAIAKGLRVFLTTAMLLLASVEASADCLNEYNNALVTCDRYFCDNGIFTCAGCKADAWSDYYGCIYERATN